MRVFINKILRKLCFLIINVFFSTTNFFTIKRFLLRTAGVEIGIDSKLVGPINMGTVAKLSIGDNCWIGSGVTIYGNGCVSIGDRCDLAPDVGFITGSHEIGDENRRAGKGSSHHIKIGNGCWIGARVSILGDVTISDSSIIGSTSLVNKDIEKNVIAVGLPAKKIKEL
jgi:maltose O-acetyltransferase